MTVARREHDLAKTIPGPLRSMLLDECESAVEDDHSEDGHAKFGKARDESEGASYPKQGGEEAEQLGEQLA